MMVRLLSALILLSVSFNSVAEVELDDSGSITVTLQPYGSAVLIFNDL